MATDAPVSVVAARPTAPRLVAGDVRVLLLERLVAGVRTACTGVADHDQRHAGAPEHEVQQPHVTPLRLP